MARKVLSAQILFIFPKVFLNSRACLKNSHRNLVSLETAVLICGLVTTCLLFLQLPRRASTTLKIDSRLCLVLGQGLDGWWALPNDQEAAKKLKISPFYVAESTIDDIRVLEPELRRGASTRHALQALDSKALLCVHSICRGKVVYFG